jgi:carboxyl-terminal processing protease
MEQQPRLPLWFFAVNCAVVLLAFVLGHQLAGWSRPKLPNPQSQAFDLVYQEILKSHVDVQDGAALLDRAIAAMARVDDYSLYVPPRELERYEESSTGRYEGIGVLQQMHGEALVVHFPFPGSPADRAGLRPGDCIVAVDGTPVASFPAEQRNAKVRELVRGPADSAVTLRVRRDDAEFDLAVRRGAVQRPAVKWVHLLSPGGRLGYLHLSDFHGGAAAEVLAAIDQLAADGPLRGLVLDLRHNLGGSLDECVRLARAFQPSGTIVSTRRRDQVLTTLAADPSQCRHAQLPLVLLVNHESASASEVLAGCLQDHGRAALVGTRTFGKGFVNTVYTWGSLPFRLKLTTAHYYTPNGRNIDGTAQRRRNGSSAANGEAPPAAGGIAPDFEVPASEAERLAIATTLAEIEPPAAHLPALAKAAAVHSFAVPMPPQATTDPQLAKALEVLAARADAAASAPTTSSEARNR